MSCSTEEYKQMKEALNSNKFYVVLDPLDERFIGLSMEDCKLAVIGCVNESPNLAHLANKLMPEDIILVSPEQVRSEYIEEYSKKAREVMLLIGGREMERAASIIEAAKQIVNEVCYKKELESKPTPYEVRQRNQEYRNRQRHHNRRR